MNSFWSDSFCLGKIFSSSSKRPWIRWACLFLLFSSVVIAASPTPTSLLISKIQFVGLKRIQESALRSILHTHEGDMLSLPLLQKDVQRLQKTGFFSSVKVAIQRKGALVHLIFDLKEEVHWVYQVYFMGNSLLKAETLQQLIQTKPGMNYKQSRLIQDARTIIKAYYQLGHFHAKVSVNGSNQAKGLVLWFQISEGETAKIKSVSFSGNKSISEKKLRKRLDSQPAGVFTSLTGKGYYHPSYVARDIYFIRNYYLDQGFLNVKVGQPKLFIRKDRKKVSLHYHIQEGPRYQFGQFFFGGDLIYPLKKLRSFVRFRKGDWFHRTNLYQKMIYPLLIEYKNKGHAFANIQPLPVVQSNNVVDVHLRIRKGRIYRIQSISFEGNTWTQARVLRQRLLIREKEVFNLNRLRISQKRIFSLGYFQSTEDNLGVSVKITKASQKGWLNIVFVVKEKSNLLYNLGFNFLQEQGFLFAAQLGHRNFLGQGQTLLGRGTISSTLRVWNFYMYFMDPHLFQTDLGFTFSTYITHYSSVALGFSKDALGVDLSLSYPLWKVLQAEVGYRIASNSIAPEQFDIVRIQGFSKGTWRSSAFRLALRWDSRNNFQSPSEGSHHFLTVEQNASAIGASYNLTKLEAGTRWYFSLPWNMTVRFAGTFGWLYSPDSLGAPLFEKYFLGGVDSLRGFVLDSISPKMVTPKNADGAFTRALFSKGGEKKFLFNLEWEFPLIPSMKIRGVLFLDVGNTFSSKERWFEDLQDPHTILGMFWNAGAGIRWTLPNIGVIRFEFGIPFNPRPGDPQFLFNFTIGETIF